MVRATARRSAGTWGGVASFNGAVVTAPAPPDFVRTLLPPPLMLDANSARAHDLVFFFGELEHGGAHIGGVDWSLGARYREMGVLVPCVRHPDHAGHLLFPYEMAADDATAITLGNAVYGLRKRNARIGWDGPSYEVHVEGRRKFQCTGSIHGEFSKRRVSDARLVASLLRIVAHPVLGLRNHEDYVRSHFEWDFTRAATRPLSVALEWAPIARDVPFVSTVNMDRALLVRGMRWRTSPPAPTS